MAFGIRRSGPRALAWLILPPLLAACSLSGQATPTATRTQASPTSVAVVPSASAIVGSPRPGGTATFSPIPPTASLPIATPATPPRPVATPLAASPTPLGAIPAGWRVYQGPLPFAVAYPPDWQVDESQLTSNLVYFFAPGRDQNTFVVIGTTGAATEEQNLDVLRDRWFQSRRRSCGGSGIGSSGREAIHGIEYATVGATCDLPTGLAYSLTGLGLRGKVPWIFEFNAPYDTFKGAEADVFRPMIATLNIYGGASSR